MVRADESREELLRCTLARSSSRGPLWLVFPLKLKHLMASLSFRATFGRTHNDHHGELPIVSYRIAYGKTHEGCEEGSGKRELWAIEDVSMAT